MGLYNPAAPAPAQSLQLSGAWRGKVTRSRSTDLTRARTGGSQTPSLFPIYPRKLDVGKLWSPRQRPRPGDLSRLPNSGPTQHPVLQWQQVVMLTGRPRLGEPGPLRRLQDSREEWPLGAWQVFQRGASGEGECDGLCLLSDGVSWCVWSRVRSWPAGVSVGQTPVWPDTSASLRPCPYLVLCGPSRSCSALQ